MKVAIVTGAARGLGAAIAHRLYDGGWSLVLGDIDVDAVTMLAADLGRDAVPIALDVREPASWERAVTARPVGGDLGPSSTARRAPRFAELLAIEPEEWDDVMATNLRGPLPRDPRASGRTSVLAARARIVNIALRLGLPRPRRHRRPITRRPRPACSP